MSENKAQKGKFPDKETSDLFSISSYKEERPSIGAIEKVPLAPEEVRRKRILRITWAVIITIASVLALWLFVYLKHAAAVSGSIAQAEDDGRVNSMGAALALLESDDDPLSQALTLRVEAMLVLAGADQDAAAIGVALAEVSDEGEAGQQKGIAATYLALAAGDLSTAMERASSISATGDYVAEAARARALAARSVGNVDQALSAAQAAAEERPNSPRHVALLAELMARSGDVEGALTSLDRLSELSNPALEIARARIMDRAGQEISAVAERANVVLEDERATTQERVWARLLLARAAASAGDRVLARRHLDQAAQNAPAGDELFTLGLTEAALRNGASVLARSAAERLPSPLSVDAGRRALLAAELALDSHDLRMAESSLARAPEGPRRMLAQARLLRARGQVEEARPLYLGAAEESAFQVPATVGLAAMELDADRAAQAAELIGPLLETHPNHPDVVPVAVDAQLGLRQPARALALVEPALEAHPEDVRLLAANAHVHMAQEHWEQALTTLDSALTIEADDPNLHADRGRVGQRLNRTEMAREAFDAALALSPSHPIALLGRLQLDVAEFQAEGGRQIIDRIDEAEMHSLTIERLRARLLNVEVAGHSGVAALQRALRQHADDPVLTSCLGWLYVQSEELAMAIRTFNRLLGGDNRMGLEPLLARAVAKIRMRLSAPVQSMIEGLAEDEDFDEAQLPPAIGAQLQAIRARLSWVERSGARAQEHARQALELDSHNTLAHLVLADVIVGDDGDATAEQALALIGPHPSARPLALLSIRETALSDEVCELARRYRRAAPSGQYSRGAWRVLRDCRHR